MRTIVLLLFICLRVFSQDSNQVVLTCNVGVGGSQFKHYLHNSESLIDLGYSTKIGISVDYIGLNLTVDHSVNKLVTSPENKMTLSSVLLGYAFNTFTSIPGIRVIQKLGFGSLQSVKLGNEIHYSLTYSEYEHIVERSFSTNAQIDLELRVERYLGFYFEYFTSFNNIRRVGGLNCGVIIGTF